MVTSAKIGSDDVFAFRQFRSVAGYEIRASSGKEAAAKPSKSSEVLGAAGGGPEIYPKGVDIEPVWPLRDTNDLAKEFAQVGKTDADVVAFVNRYGLLYPADSTRNTVQKFRLAQEWIAALLRTLRADKWRASLSDNSHVEQFRAARRELGAWFNIEAPKHFNFHLQLPTTKHAADSLRIVPDSLMSAIGLAAAYEIAGEIEWHICANCGKRFMRGAHRGYMRKSDAETCSVQCNQKRLDERKAERAKAVRATSKTAAPRQCAHCYETFIPKPRANAAPDNCGKPACKTAASRARAKGRTP